MNKPDIKALVVRIREAALELPEYPEDWREKIDFQDQGFRVSCLKSSTAALAMAEKLERGLPGRVKARSLARMFQSLNKEGCFDWRSDLRRSGVSM